MQKEKVCLDVFNLNFKKSSLNEVITIPVEIILCIFLIIIFSFSVSQNKYKTNHKIYYFFFFFLYHSATKALKSWPKSYVYECKPFKRGINLKFVGH